MAKPNYAFEKRQRELEKKKKKEEKAQRKAQGAQAQEGPEDQEAVHGDPTPQDAPPATPA